MFLILNSSISQNKVLCIVQEEKINHQSYPFVNTENSMKIALVRHTYKLNTGPDMIASIYFKIEF